MKKTLTKMLSLAIALAGIASNFASDESAPGAAKTATAVAKQVDESKLSPASVKVVRLLQAGMDEKVIVAYVKNNPTTKALRAEELMYLHELGVSSSVLTAMLTPAKKTETAQAAVPVTIAPEKVEATSNYTPIPGAPQSAQMNGSAVISTPVAAPAPVIVQQPAQPTIVYTQPAPVIVESAPPVYYDNRPTFSFGFGLGHFGHHGHGGHHSIFRHGHHGHGGHFGGHGGHQGGHRGRH